MKEYLKLALKSIKNNKARSFLTMIGIIIGIASVIMIMSVGNGVKNTLVSEMNSLFSGQIIIYASSDGGYTMENMFDEDDMDAIRKQIPHVKGVVAQVTLGDVVEGSRRTYDGTYELVNPDYDFTKQNKIIRGRNFTWEEYNDAAKVCVIQEESALAYFGSTNVIGETIEITLLNKIVPLRIIGVREKAESAMVNMLEFSSEISLEIPGTLVNSIYGMVLFGNEAMLTVLAEAPEYSAQVAQDCVRLLEGRKDVRGENIIQVEEFSSALDEISVIINFITLFIAFVAAVSLLVGGIGVMNIMLVSVTERTREIGIRKALGATTGSIMLQFLAESAMITLIGGIVGLILGWTGGGVVCAVISSMAKITITAMINIPTILLICGFSSVIGIFFGIYPARKAAKLNPIEALRHE